MPETLKATQFTAPSGKSFAFTREMDYPSDGELLFSPDGVTFYALAVSVLNNEFDHDVLIELKLSFTNPHDATSGELEYKDGVITCGGEKFTQHNFGVSESSIVQLPDTREVEYLCKAEDGTLFYVSSGKYSYSYQSFRLHIGDGTTMREVAVANVNRFRDGGTTYINTDEETFFSPTPFNPKLVPLWGEQELIRLNQDDFDIVETPNREVSIAKRQ